MFNLGDTAKDSITGFKGTITYKIEYLHGCVRYGIQPTVLKDGSPIENQVFDEQQLILVSKKKSTKVEKKGGDRPLPNHRSIPSRF